MVNAHFAGDVQASHGTDYRSVFNRKYSKSMMPDVARLAYQTYHLEAKWHSYNDLSYLLLTVESLWLPICQWIFWYSHLTLGFLDIPYPNPDWISEKTARYTPAFEHEQNPNSWWTPCPLNPGHVRAMLFRAAATMLQQKQAHLVEFWGAPRFFWLFLHASLEFETATCWREDVFRWCRQNLRRLHTTMTSPSSVIMGVPRSAEFALTSANWNTTPKNHWISQRM